MGGVDHRGAGVLALGAQQVDRARLGVVGGQQQRQGGGLHRRVAEVALERLHEALVRVALVEVAAERGDLLEQRAVEDLRALLDVERRRSRTAGSGSGLPSAQARIPPVEVPAIMSTRSAIRCPVRASISASTSAGISPRMPPPSIERTFTRRRLRARSRGSRRPRASPRRGSSCRSAAPARPRRAGRGTARVACSTPIRRTSSGTVGDRVQARGERQRHLGARHRRHPLELADVGDRHDARHDRRVDADRVDERARSPTPGAGTGSARSPPPAASRPARRRSEARDGRRRVALGVHGHADRREADLARERDQLDRVAQVALRERGVRRQRRVAVQRQQVAHAGRQVALSSATSSARPCAAHVRCASGSSSVPASRATSSCVRSRVEPPAP